MTRRNTHHRVETYDLLSEHASQDNTVRLSNRVIRDMLSTSDRHLTLPAVTARLQSLERMGSISIRYHVGDYGRVHREIRLLHRPSPPQSPRKPVTA